MFPVGLNTYAALWHNHALSRSKIDVFEAAAADALECDRLKNGHPRQGSHCTHKAVTSHVKRYYNIARDVTRQTSKVKPSHVKRYNVARHTLHVTRHTSHMIKRMHSSERTEIHQAHCMPAQQVCMSISTHDRNKVKIKKIPSRSMSHLPFGLRSRHASPGGQRRKLNSQDSIALAGSV